MEPRLENEIWISGEIFGLADIIVLPLIDRMEDLSFANMWTDNFPKVSGWFERSKARASYDTAFYSMTRLSDLLTIGPLIRSQD